LQDDRNGAYRFSQDDCIGFVRNRFLRSFHLLIED
jgi:hypothetical protein